MLVSSSFFQLGECDLACLLESVRECDLELQGSAKGVAQS